MWTLVVLLDLNLVDLVVAVHMIELCAHDHRGLFNVKILRSLFLTCCVISRKVNTDVRRVGDDQKLVCELWSLKRRFGPAW